MQTEPTKRSVNDPPETAVEIRVYPHSAKIEKQHAEIEASLDLIVIQISANVDECDISIRVPMSTEEKEVLKIYGLHPSDLRELAKAMIIAADIGERK